MSMEDYEGGQTGQPSYDNPMFCSMLERTVSFFFFLSLPGIATMIVFLGGGDRYLVIGVLGIKCIDSRIETGDLVDCGGFNLWELHKCR